MVPLSRVLVGEGRGEGDFELRATLELEITLTLALSHEYAGEGTVFGTRRMNYTVFY
jgi:hypothetical protein